MKRYLLLIMMSIFSIGSIQAEISWTLSDDGTLTISGTGDIRDNAWEGCKDIKNVVIEYGVTRIGGWAFSSCGSLTSVTIPESVTSIGNNAFAFCSMLPSIVIPNSVTSIEDQTFEHCYSLTSITIPNSVTNIGYSAFRECTSLTSITIPNSVTSIGNLAFYWSGLTSITIPNSVTSIGERAFRYCHSLTSVTCEATTPPSDEFYYNSFYYADKSIPLYVPANSVEAYKAAEGWMEFENILAIENAGMTWALSDDGTLTISGKAMPDYDESPDPTPWAYQREGIKKVVIKNGVTNIGNKAFRWCQNLESVTIPETVKSIGDEAFLQCRNLISINIPSSVTSIGDKAFQECESLISITLPNSVKSIGVAVFQGCKSLTSFTIPNSLTSIEDCMFAGCEKLSSVTIPNSVKIIKDRSFHVCYSLTSVTIPNSVTSIEYCAFADCKSLTSITIPGSVKNIGIAAFGGCKGLVSVTLLDGVTNIENGAFSECNNLVYVTLPNSVVKIGNEAFRWCTKLSSITIPNSVTSIGEFAFSSCDDLTSITIPNSVTSIGNHAFDGCGNLASVTIGNSVMSIGNEAFRGCPFTSITIPNSVKGIGWWAFSRCKNLTSITIPNSVEYIGTGAFEYCEALTSITIPNSTTSILSGTFLYCLGLKSVTIPNSVKTIEEAAFRGCYALSSVTIPSSVTKIEFGAFNECPNLTSITCEAVTPPDCGDGQGHFDYVNKSIPVFVPENSVEAYKAAEQWNEFTSIRPIGHYFVTLDHNKGVGDPEQILVAYNQPMPEDIGLIAPTRKGYVFNGYSVNGIFYYDANLKSVRNFDKKQDCTLLASWKLRTTIVTLNPKCSNNDTLKVTATYGKAMPTGENIVAPTRAGYTFAGYYSSENGKGTQYYNADMTSKRTWNKDVESMTLYAYWKAITIPVTDIALSDATATLWVDEEKTLTATVTPTNASNKAVTWTSSNTAVATVSANGLIKAIAKGTATITCKAADGSGIYKKCTVTVKQPVTSIALSASEATLWVGKSQKLTATVNPTTASKTTVNWYSSDENVATISKYGYIKAKGRGTCVITCEAADGYGTKTVCDVTVKQQVTSVSFSYETLSVTCGTTKTLTPRIYPSNADIKTLTWKSTDKSVATVTSEGVLKAIALGTAKIICTATDGFKKADTITVEVVPLKITDSKPAIAEGTYGAGCISYTRTLTAGKYAAFCLPYTVNLDDYTDEFSKVYVPMGIALHKSNGTVMISLKKVSLTETIRAGQPFVALAAKSGSVAIVNDVKVTIASLAEPKENKLEVYDLGSSFITYNPDIEVKITGNYAKITDLDNTNNFIFSTSGSMSKAASVSPYRLYVTKNDEHSDAKITDIQFSFEEDETVTGIEDLKIVNEELPVDESPIYNLKGQRVNRANAQQKGVYIKNGKKVIVK